MDPRPHAALTDIEDGSDLCPRGHRRWPWERILDEDTSFVFLNGCTTCQNEADGTQLALFPEDRARQGRRGARGA